METSFTRLMGIDHPVVQAPIGGLSVPALAGAVSNAGGLGMMAITWMTLDEIREAIAAARAITDRPFGVNVIIDRSDEPQDERVEVALAAGAPVVSFFWGDPAPFVDRVHAAGAKATFTAGSAEEAKRASDAGVDVIVAQGWEAGGHVWGQVSTLALVPAVVDAVGETPVLAAGGITDGRGLAAALALGAGGAWMGTRFVASDEAPAHPHWQERILRARETETFYGTLFDIGWPNAPHRTLRNATIDAWLAAGSPPSGQRPGEGEVLARRPDGSEVVRYSSVSARATVDGSIDELSLWCGQGVALVHEVLPAAEIVRRTVAEARSTLASLASLAEEGRAATVPG
jgi:NAD(P)H-dependent flavin oxidoreductase YrpB (nitropropane dioxygenase family)